MKVMYNLSHKSPPGVCTCPPVDGTEKMWEVVNEWWQFDGRWRLLIARENPKKPEILKLRNKRGLLEMSPNLTVILKFPRHYHNNAERKWSKLLMITNKFCSTKLGLSLQLQLSYWQGSHLLATFSSNVLVPPYSGVEIIRNVSLLLEFVYYTDF